MIKTKEYKKYVKNSKDLMTISNQGKIYSNIMTQSLKSNLKIFLSKGIFPRKREKKLKKNGKKKNRDLEN